MSALSAIGVFLASSLASVFALGGNSFTFNPTPKDSSMIELGEWATRNSLYSSDHEGASSKKLSLYVVGCSGQGECFFIHEGGARIRLFEPRLKSDWVKLLKSERTKSTVREMACVSPADTPINAPSGKCTIRDSSRTRHQLRRLSPELARHLGDERSPAEIKVLRRKGR